VENPTENYRIRKCQIMYHLDDDTVYISEPRVENSGIPQGVLMKRHKVPNPNCPGESYTWRDLNVSANISIYGRVYRIVSCDDFTRSFFQNAGMSLNAPEQYPEDLFANHRTMINMKQDPPDLAESKEY
jgi:hypothetical protein